MKQADLRILIKGGETETVEFKTSFDKETLETSGAFANTKGGIILTGVSDKGEIKGIRIGKETMRYWANQIYQSTGPRIIPEIEIGTIDGKNVAVIRIKEFPIKPVFIKRRIHFHPSQRRHKSAIKTPSSRSNHFLIRGRVYGKEENRMV